MDPDRALETLPDRVTAGIEVRIQPLWRIHVLHVNYVFRTAVGLQQLIRIEAGVPPVAVVELKDRRVGIAKYASENASAEVSHNIP